MNFKINPLIACILPFFTLFSCTQNKKTEEVKKPNIIIVYIDDLGYGDVGFQGAKGVSTPNIDALAKNGLVFTDGHCSASTCTPSRYSLLTGSYAFRNNAAILPGDAPLLIDTNKTTMPAMLQKAGYKTAVIGKWHLGLGNGYIDWNKTISPGPNELGFDYSFLVPATLDRVPCVFVENHHVVNLDPKDPIKVDYNKDLGAYPNGLEEPQLLKFGADKQHSNTIINGISRIGFMSGGKSALWKDEDMAKVLMGKVNNFLSENKENPFFLYFSFTDIHVPRAPNEMFKDKSTMGSRGDDIAQMDWSVGELMKALKSKGLDKNTLIIFTSDNGPVLNDGYDDKAEELVGDHKPGGPLKGGKYSIYEAGTRVPTVVYWPEKVKPGTSEALVNQVDLFASLAKLTGQKLAPKDAPDSFDVLDALLGKSKTGRDVMLEEGFTLALRDNNWKFIAPQSKPTPNWLKNKNIASGLQETPQLFDLKSDISETKNLAATNKQKADEMAAILNKIKTQKGSRLGYSE
ncbi:arylsulfatase [Pedobacter sp. SD-b]|uniref:Arylsulfatase n=1 Tax=Pedobacter segetis TaxID=2793069 RepID=A0ABS1BMM9_9SPHI|nr:arylsulfatase [Pedobacter segetis]MBK0384068.1 arylsulfatase [Pedobacter segetis]